jgi:hypothetical protein
MCFVFHSGNHNLTNFILKVAKCDQNGEHWYVALPEWLADVTELVNLPVRSHVGDRQLTGERGSFWYFDILWECRVIE